MHKEDFVYSPRTRRTFKYLARLFATRPASFLIRYCGLNRFVIKFFYLRLPNTKRRMIEVTPEEFADTIEFDVKLWHKNDVRTHWITTSQFFTLDNCTKQINLPLVHVISKEEQYFNNEIVKQHMLVVFKSYKSYTADSKAHTPSILGDKDAMGVFLPPGLRKLLAQA